MNLPTLIDVALGLALVFFILASIGSVVAELWAAHRKLRHRLLRDTVNRLLGPDIAARFWAHSLILPLYEPPPAEEQTKSPGDDLLAKARHYAALAAAKSWKAATNAPRWLTTGRRADAPAYLEAQLFATVLLDLASGEGALGPIPNDRASWEATIKANIMEIIGDANDLEDHLLALLRQLPENTPDFAAALKVAVTKWYQEAMQRSSGTYRRKTQKTLLVVGAVLALALNVDAIRIAQILYLNPQLRADVAAQAEAVAQDRQAAANDVPALAAAETRSTPDAGNPASVAPKSPDQPPAIGQGNPAPAGPAASTAAATGTVQAKAPLPPREQLRESAAQLRDLAKIGFPLGWQHPWEEGFFFLKSGEPTASSWLAKLFGLAISALAVCLGAPFWFDVIGRLVKLRSSAGAEAEKAKTSPASGAADSPAPASAPGSPAAAAPLPSGTAPATPASPLPDALAALAPGTAAGFDVARAYWIAEFADHAYETNPALLAAWLQQHKFTLKASFSDAATDTQAFLAVAEKTAVLAFRGTENTLTDWFTDAKIAQIPDPSGVVPGHLHTGFITALNSVAAALDPELAALRAAGVTLHVTGHSLGGALAVLAALRCESRPDSAGLVATVHTYGSPRAGDPAFAAAFDRALRGRAFRLVNNEDIVTRIPPTELPVAGQVLRYEHVGEMKFIDPQGKIIGDVSFMFRLLNFTTNALGNLRTAVATTFHDHSMRHYCSFLRNAA